MSILVSWSIATAAAELGHSTHVHSNVTYKVALLDLNLRNPARMHLVLTCFTPKPKTLAILYPSENLVVKWIIDVLACRLQRTGFVDVEAEIRSTIGCLIHLQASCMHACQSFIISPSSVCHIEYIYIPAKPSKTIPTPRPPVFPHFQHSTECFSSWPFRHSVTKYMYQ